MENNRKLNEMVGGIYAIVCNGNGKIYIGGSKNVKSRIAVHVNLLSRMKHENKYLQSAWNLYGKESFIFDMIEHCNIEEIIGLNAKGYRR